MDFQQALAELRSFWNGPLPIGPGAPEALRRLDEEFGRALPPALRTYVAELAPSDTVTFEGVGNPLSLWGEKELSARLPGYNVDGRTGAPLEEWKPSWFLIADCGAAPVVLDLDDPAASETARWPVLMAPHGWGTWEFSSTADSLPQFLLLAAALHHALNHVVADPIKETDCGFVLAEPAAEWLFPRFREWAPSHSAGWLDLFSNFRNPRGR